MADTTVEIEELAELLRKVSPDLYEKPLRNFFDRAGIAITNKAKEWSPVDTGRLKSSLGMGAREAIWERIKGGGLRVGTNVTHRGVSYPRILDESSRHHYIGTQRRGSPTHDWFTGGVARAKGDIEKSIARLAKDIGKEWSR